MPSHKIYKVFFSRNIFVVFDTIYQLYLIIGENILFSSNKAGDINHQIIRYENFPNLYYIFYFLDIAEFSTFVTDLLPSNHDELDSGNLIFFIRLPFWSTSVYLIKKQYK